MILSRCVRFLSAKASSADDTESTLGYFCEIELTAQSFLAKNSFHLVGIFMSCIFNFVKEYSLHLKTQQTSDGFYFGVFYSCL